MSNFINRATESAKTHSPELLAAAAVLGVATTGVFAYRAGRQYGQAEIEATHILNPNGHVLTGKEKFEMGWRNLVLPFSSGLITSVAVIGGTTILRRRNTALLSAVALSEAAFREYRDKAIEVGGKTKDKKVVDAIAQDQVDATENREILFVGDGNVLCFDRLTGRYFESNKPELERAEIEINRQILGQMYASQNDWYERIGLDRVSDGDNVGWNNDNPLEVEFSAIFKNDKPVMAIGYRFQPKIGFAKIW